ncbi:adhesion G protein-coupled receptor E3, partial [Biomphalaria glabrata]
ETVNLERSERASFVPNLNVSSQKMLEVTRSQINATLSNLESNVLSSKEAGFKTCNLSINFMKSSGRRCGCSQSLDLDPDADGNMYSYAERCDDNTNDFQHPAVCRCDRMCWLYGDCCPDFFGVGLKKDVTDSEDSLLKSELSAAITFSRFTSFYEKFHWFRLSTCEPIWPDFQHSFYLITKCSEEVEIKERFDLVFRNVKQSSSVISQIFLELSKDEIVDRCERKKKSLDDPFNYIPIAIDKLMGIYYYNIFCAICNANDINRSKLWTIEVISDQKTKAQISKTIYTLYEFNQFMRNNSIRLTEPHFATACFPVPHKEEFPNTDFRHAVNSSQLATSVNVEEGGLGLLCSRYRLLIKENGMLFNNPHCYALHSGQNATDFNISFEFVVKMASNSSVCYPKLAKEREPVSLLFLLHNRKSNDDMSTQIMFKDKTCPDNKTYVPFYDTCVTPYCPDGTWFINNSCRTQGKVKAKELEIELENSWPGASIKKYQFTPLKNTHRQLTITYALLNTLNSQRYLLKLESSSESRNQKVKLSRISRKGEFLSEWFQLAKPKSLEELKDIFTEMIKIFLMLYIEKKRTLITDVVIYAYIDSTDAHFKWNHGQSIMISVQGITTRVILVNEEIMLAKHITMSDDVVVNPCAVVLGRIPTGQGVAYDTCLSIKAELKREVYFDDLVSNTIEEGGDVKVLSNFVISYRSMANMVPLNRSIRLTKTSAKNKMAKHLLEPELFSQHELGEHMCSQGDKLVTKETQVFTKGQGFELYTKGPAKIKLPNVEYWIEYLMSKQNSYYIHTLTYAFCELLPLQNRCSAGQLVSIDRSKILQLGGRLIVTSKADALLKYINRLNRSIASLNETRVNEILDTFASQHAESLDVVKLSIIEGEILSIRAGGNSIRAGENSQSDQGKTQSKQGKALNQSWGKLSIRAGENSQSELGKTQSELGKTLNQSWWKLSIRAGGNSIRAGENSQSELVKPLNQIRGKLSIRAGENSQS